ncbi:4227_t:CDS:2, partial [Funneliformis geosporum]
NTIILLPSVGAAEVKKIVVADDIILGTVLPYSSLTEKTIKSPEACALQSEVFLLPMTRISLID